MSVLLQLAGVIAALFAVSFWLYRASFPKPIPGIPYDEKSANRPFGDLQDLLKYQAETGEAISFLEKKCLELGSPICQVFARPFGRPWVVLMDTREADDIMGRRSQEFDRSEFFRDLLEAILPNMHVILPTNDKYRYHKRLVGDIMSPRFLNTVATDEIYQNTLNLVELFREKIRIARGHVVDISDDIRYCTVDTIWAATFGGAVGTAKSQRDYLATMDKMAPATEPPKEVTKFPVLKLPEIFTALWDLATSSEIPMKSPAGRLHHWFAINFYPRYRHAIHARDTLVRKTLDRAWKVFEDSNLKDSASKVRCIVDLIIERETTLAKKHGRAPNKQTEILGAELNGILNAGFETTAVSIGWALKYLTKYQGVQKKLRQSLQEAFPGGHPTSRDLAETKLPYLDAFIEEALWHGKTIAANIRLATTDAVVLGHVIPKGSDIFMPTPRPSHVDPALRSIEENKRSASSHASKSTSDKWDHNSEGTFSPERWLTTDSRTGKLEFNPNAAAAQMFGKGQRGCFGKKMAYLELQIILTLIVWNFELLPLPPHLEDFRASDVITHQPVNVRAILKEVDAS